MSPGRLRNPQLGRLARLLDVEADALAGLDAVPDDQLRDLHEQISRAVFGNYQHRFARVAGLSQELPPAVAGKLAERFLPPVLAARVAELLTPAKAQELVSKVSVSYLADLALALDPTRSEPVVQAIPADRIGQVARALFDRDEYAAMAEFAATVTLEALFTALEAASARDLLTVVPLLVWNPQIDQVIDEMPGERIDELLGEIVTAGPWDEGNYLIDRLPPQAQQRLRGRIEVVSVETFTALRTAADNGQLGATAMNLLEQADETRRRSTT